MVQSETPMWSEVRGTVVDESGRAMAGIAVSNEEQIVLTDAEGRFVLPFVLGRHRFVWACRPEGYSGGRWFHRLPTEGEVRLLLEHSPLPHSGVRIAHVTDLHLEAAPESRVGPKHLSETLSAVLRVAAPVHLLVATGDLTNRGDRESLGALRQILDAQPVPVVALFGGHDGNTERAKGPEALPWIQHWQEAIGPTHFSLDVAGWHLVAYPDEKSFFGETMPMHDAWLQADLERAHRAGKPILLARHTPPDTSFVERVAPYGVRTILFGHWHSSKVWTHQGISIFGTPTQVFGGIDTMPRGVRVVELGTDSVRSHYVPLRQTPSEPPKRQGNMTIVWKADAGSPLHRGEPLVAGDAVYVPVPDEEHQGRAGILCLDIATGALRWRTPTSHSVRGNLATAGDRLFAVTQTGEVLALELASGKIVWSHRLEGYPDRWIYDGPVVSGDVVVAGTGSGGLEGLRRTDGIRIWPQGKARRGGDGWSHYCTPAVREEDVMAMVFRVGVRCLQAATGTEKWHFDCRYEYNLAAPCLAGEWLLVPASGGDIYALDAKTGAVVWHQKTGGSGAIQWATDGDLLVLHTLEGITECRKVQDGAFLWKFQGSPDLLDMIPYRYGGASAVARPVFTQKGVFLFGADGCVRLLEKQSGAVTAALPLGEAIVAAAAGPDDSAIIALWNGQVVRLAP